MSKGTEELLCVVGVGIVLEFFPYEKQFAAVHFPSAMQELRKYWAEHFSTRLNQPLSVNGIPPDPPTACSAKNRHTPYSQSATEGCLIHELWYERWHLSWPIKQEALMSRTYYKVYRQILRIFVTLLLFQQEQGKQSRLETTSGGCQSSLIS